MKNWTINKETFIILVLGVVAVACIIVKPQQIELAKIVCIGIIGYLGANNLDSK